MLCGICLFTARKRGHEELAVTVINGHAACEKHIENAANASHDFGVIIHRIELRRKEHEEAMEALADSLKKE
jgi:hypothetical protein